MRDDVEGLARTDPKFLSTLRLGHSGLGAHGNACHKPTLAARGKLRQKITTPPDRKECTRAIQKQT